MTDSNATKLYKVPGKQVDMVVIDEPQERDSNATLLPCPFCGGEAFPNIELRKHWVECRECAAESGCYRTEAEAIEAWNTRATRTCEMIHHEVEMPKELKEAGVEMFVYECSECGERTFCDYNYCPNCGAKVCTEEP